MKWLLLDDKTLINLDKVSQIRLEQMIIVFVFADGEYRARYDTAVNAKDAFECLNGCLTK